MTQVLSRRFPTKKAFKDAVRRGEAVGLVATSCFGNEKSGLLSSLPDGDYFVVGPSEYERKWYSHITVSGGGVIVR